eukprot:2449412-Rhodomonas_salina.1
MLRCFFVKSKARCARCYCCVSVDSSHSGRQLPPFTHYAPPVSEKSTCICLVNERVATNEREDFLVKKRFYGLKTSSPARSVIQKYWPQHVWQGQGSCQCRAARPGPVLIENSSSELQIGYKETLESDSRIADCSDCRDASEVLTFFDSLHLPDSTVFPFFIRSSNDSESLPMDSCHVSAFLPRGCGCTQSSRGIAERGVRKQPAAPG